jgi:hypothetical protein
MQVKTLLNFVTDYKSFVFTKVWKVDSDCQNDVPSYFAVEVASRKNSQGVCPECGRKYPTYDTADEPRWFEFVPLWKIPVWFAYRMRRVTCPVHGVVTEQVPWGGAGEEQIYFPEEPGEPGGKAGSQVEGTVGLQPTNDPGIPDEGRV